MRTCFVSFAITHRLVVLSKKCSIKIRVDIRVLKNILGGRFAIHINDRRKQHQRYTEISTIAGLTIKSTFENS